MDLPAVDQCAAKRNTPVATRRHAVPVMKSVAAEPAVFQVLIVVLMVLIAAKMDTFVVQRAAARMGINAAIPFVVLPGQNVHPRASVLKALI